MKRVLLTAAWLLAPIGCAHHEAYHESKAEYHHEKAAADWETGHPVGAAKHKVEEGANELEAH